MYIKFSSDELTDNSAKKEGLLGLLTTHSRRSLRQALQQHLILPRAISILAFRFLYCFNTVLPAAIGSTGVAVVGVVSSVGGGGGEGSCAEIVWLNWNKSAHKNNLVLIPI